MAAGDIVRDDEIQRKGDGHSLLRPVFVLLENAHGRMPHATTVNETSGQEPAVYQ
jgi:hypothetical protein